MSEALEKIIERISTYEIFNNIIPGTIYVVLAEKLTPLKLQTGNVWADVVLYYFFGVVIEKPKKNTPDRRKLVRTGHAGPENQKSISLMW